MDRAKADSPVWDLPRLEEGTHGIDPCGHGTGPSRLPARQPGREHSLHVYGDAYRQVDGSLRVAGGHDWPGVMPGDSKQRIFWQVGMGFMWDGFKAALFGVPNGKLNSRAGKASFFGALIRLPYWMIKGTLWDTPKTILKIGRRLLKLLRLLKLAGMG